MRKKVLLISAIVIAFILASGYCIKNNISSNSIVTIYLVRHGQTEANVKGLLVGGGGDSPLTDEGIAGVEATGRMLSDVKFTHAYSSELGRAITTRDIILNDNQVSDTCLTSELDGLNDISWGEAEGLTPEEASELTDDLSNEAVFGTIDDMEFVSPIGAESMYSFYDRFNKAMLQIVNDADNQGENVLVVAHSSMTFWLMEEFQDISLNKMDNAGVTIIQYDNGEWNLVEFNELPSE